MDCEYYDVCVNCLKIYAHHADTKCLYEPTYFERVACWYCKTSESETLATFIVNDVRCFRCKACIFVKITQHPDYDTAYLINEQYVYHWIQMDAY